VTDAETIAVLQAELAASRSQVAELLQQLAKLTDRVAELTALLGRKARKSREPAPSSTPDASASALPEGRPSPPALPPEPEKAPTSGRPSGRKPPPEHLEVVPESHRPDACRHCGATELRVIGEEQVDKIDTVREHLRTRRIVRKTCRCNACNKTTTAEMPPMPWARSKFTSEVVAHIVHQKVGRHVPLEGIGNSIGLPGV
jgi:transposase/uncharacterized coiled-coil protein SlyX